VLLAIDCKPRAAEVTLNYEHWFVWFIKVDSR